MDKRAVIAIAAVIIIIAAGVPAYLYLSSYNDGTIRLSAADAPIMGGMSAVYITFSEIAMHSNGSSWSNFSISATTVNILNVSENASAFFSSISLPAGKYTMMRIMIQSVSVMILGNNVSFNLASHWCFVNHPFLVNPHSTLNVVLEFNLNECLNMQSKMFTPYVGVFVS